MQSVSVTWSFVVSWNVLTYRRTLQIVRMISCLCMRITATYNPSLFSKARIATTLTQLFQIIEGASTDLSQPVGVIDLLIPTQGKLFPDPTRDLGWSGFRHAIHDIFSRDAEAHPERLCVVETRAGLTPERSFTYK